MSTRISTVQLNNLTLGSAMSVQAQYAQAATQEASGLNATNFADLGGANSSQMLNLEHEIQQAQTWSSDATTVGFRTQAMYSTLGNMATTMSTLESQISGALASTNNSNLSATITSLQQTLVAEINTKSAGDYVFAGSNTGNQPISSAGLQSYQNVGFGATGTSTSYYSGDSTVLSVQVSSVQTVSYGVTANNPAIEQAMRAMQMVLSAAQGTTTSSPAVASASASYIGPQVEQSNTTPCNQTGTITINGTNVTVAAGQSLTTIAANINLAGIVPAVTASVAGTAGNYHLAIAGGAGTTISETGTTFGLATPAVAAGTITIDGTNVPVNAGDSLTTIAGKINGTAAITAAGISASVVQDPATGTYTLRLSGLPTSATVSDTSGLNLTTASFSDQLKAALSVANTAVTSLSNLQESVAANSSQLSNISSTQNTYITYLQNSLSGVKDVDTAQAAANVSKYQTQLQASYLAVAQISKINLAQYL